jgi:hypothetical protein
VQFRDDIGEMERFSFGGGSERDRGFRDDIGEMEMMVSAPLLHEISRQHDE